MILKKGANTYLQQINNAQLELYWEAGQVSPYCLLLDKNGEMIQVIAGFEEAPFLFEQSDKRAQYSINLNWLPVEISKLVFACLKPSGKVGMAIEDIRYEVSHLYQDSAIVIGEIYRYKNGWKIRAVGEAVKGGRKELLQLYYFSEKEELPAAPRIVTVIDASIHNQELFESGNLQKLFKDLFIASSIVNPLLEMDVYFFAVLHEKGVKATKENFQSYVQNHYPQPGYFNGLGLENDEGPILDELIEEYRDSETIYYFLTSGDIPDPDLLLTRLAGTNGFWEMIVLNGEIGSGTTYRNIKVIPYPKLSTMKAGEIHQTLLRPINIWRSQTKEALVRI
ncbi:TerD family protein [Neobacillus niacini]|uniref:TerD family protein n=1 Tax=Neobacillus niacini TaxID=86668 RepID=UPI002FFE0732